MMRIGELTAGEHPVLGKNLLISKIKQKFLIILQTSKTHGKNSQPQKIKVQGNVHLTSLDTNRIHECPFDIIYKFTQLRGPINYDEEPLFIFRDGSVVKPTHVRSLLKKILRSLNLDPTLYDTHSLRIGRATDLAKYGYSVEYIKRLGRC